MNRLQAMAKILALLCEDGLIKSGTEDYKIARKLISIKIGKLGPDVAWERAQRLKGKILDQDSIEDMLEELREKYPYLEL